MTTPHIVRTKITPPRKGRRILSRPRITRRLSEALAYRLTLLQAGAGYGKSTALTVLLEEHQPVIWYQVTQEDRDPLIFLLHLCHATRLALPELAGLPFPMLQAWDGGQGPLPSLAVADQYLNALSEGLSAPVLLVLDDVHLVAESDEIAHLLDRLIGLAPPDLHILLAARPPLKLPNLAHWRARGQVLELDQSVLLFTTEEIADLFARNYEYELTHDEAQTLYQATEGWAITLQLIWQSLRSGAAVSVEETLARRIGSLDSLFEVLAQEVFGKQPADVQEFLRLSATLKVMNPQVCDALRGATDSAAMLSYLHRQELFVVDLGEGACRYHHIFHRFLRQMSPDEDQVRLHARAARYFLDQGDRDAAVYHMLQAGDHQGTADLLSVYGQTLLATGRLDTLAGYLDELPAETLHQRPALLSCLGDLARLHSRFHEALGWYQSAEALWRERGQLDNVGRALRGQARVYLDTVNPSRAEELLQHALRLSDGTADREAQARLYELLAENKLNAGKPQQAQQLRERARALIQEGPDDSELLFRVLMRTGRLEEARNALEERAEAERQHPVQTPRAHREIQLLLSIIYAFEGRAEDAQRAAQEGTRRGVVLDSPFVIAVGYLRQGHSLMLLPGEERYAEARRMFDQAIELSRELAITRLQVEANWGLCRAFGYQGDLARALELAQQGIEIAGQHGDEWIISLVRLTMGASLTLAGRYESASEWLGNAYRGFQECSDPFGSAAVQVWQCLGWYRQEENTRLRQVLPQLLAACQAQGYDFLLTRPTLLGPPDERVLVPLLILARDHGWEAPYAARLLEQLGLPGIVLHPGYQLRVMTLGTFKAWRGGQAIPSSGWRREKARQLFQLLLTYRRGPLERDQIIEHLWPDSEPDVAQRNFKVALSTLFKVLEPARKPGSDSAYILREGKVYGLRPGADLWLDAETFLAHIQQAEAQLESDPEGAQSEFEAALAIYQGDYLPETLYEPWTAEGREYLSVNFLRAADQLGALYLQNRRPHDSMRVSRLILASDNCWERAYRHLMQAYDLLGDHGQVARVYQRCRQTLQDELNVSPSPVTEALYRRIIGEGR